MSNSLVATNTMTELSKVMTQEQINEAFIKLGDYLDTTAVTAASLTVPAAGSFNLTEAGSVVSRLFPPSVAVTIVNKLSILSQGGMVPGPPPPPRLGLKRDTAPEPDPETGVFPWALLSDPVAVALMGDAVLELTGVGSPMHPNELLVHIGLEKGAPVSMLSQSFAGVSVLAEMSRRQGFKNTNTGNDGDNTQTDGGDNPLSHVSAAGLKLFEEIGNGFKSATYETFWWGYRIRFPPTFAPAFSAALLGAEAPLLQAALHALLTTSGFWAALGAAAAAVGGWVAAALLVYGLYLAVAVQANNTPRGVKVCGIWETLIPLWAQGV